MTVVRDFKPQILQDLLDTNIARLLQQEEMPSFASTFEGGDGASIGKGELIGQTTVQDGYLQSSNFVASTSGWQLTPSSGEFNFALTIASGTIGGWTIDATSIFTGTEDHSGYTANAGDMTFYSDGANSSIHAFNFYIDTAGDYHARGGDITGVAIAGIPNSTSTDISLLEKTWTMVFSVTDSNTIAWSAGTITLSNGRTFSISSGNTGNMTALTYVYVNPSVSSTVLQTTTTAATAMGANNLLIGVAQNNTVTANWIPYGPGQMLVDGEQIGALSIVAGNIAANTITGEKVSTMDLTAKTLTSDTGTIGGFTLSATTLSATNFSVTSGAANTARVQVGTGSNIAGTNSGNSGTDIAFWAGSTHANRATAPYRVNMQGDITATSATLSGYVVSTGGAFGGDGADGALSITSGTATVDLNQATYYVKNYTSISITSTGKLAFTDIPTTGVFVALRSQGAVTITSSATCIDCSSMGGSGGAGGTGSDSAVGSSGIKGQWASGTLNNGGNGSADASSATVGPGAVSPLAFLAMKNLPTMFGSGGGGGEAGDANGGTRGGGAAGGKGGGSLYIECGGAFNFTTASGISVEGGTGANGGAGSGSGSGGGGGGGGGGGTCLILYDTLTAASGTIVVSGGTGGIGGQGAVSAGGAGGAGGNGSAGTGNGGARGVPSGNGGSGGGGGVGSITGSDGSTGGATGSSGGTGGGGGGSGMSLMVANSYFL